MNETAVDNQIKHIISELVKARTARKISLRKLEKLSGVRYPTISYIENGEEIPKLDTLLKLCFALEKTLTLTSLNVDIPPTPKIE